MFLLRCPRCRKDMKYEGRTIILGAKRKSCVYCGHSFMIRNNILKKMA